jgi:hypothetical protein
MSAIPGSDWKKLRALEGRLLDKVGENILNQIATIIEKKGRENHKAYLEVFKVLGEEDAKIAHWFNDLSRSKAIFALAAWKRNGLMNDQDLPSFSEQTQERICKLSSL